jgi:predicted GNAT family acetyltransferase
MQEIEHHIEKNRFVLNRSNNECVLDYCLIERPDCQGIDFTSTYVPFALRGQGLAEELVKFGLEWAKDQGYQIEASCWYVKKFL